jgi:hypothetical protein
MIHGPYNIKSNRYSYLLLQTQYVGNVTPRSVVTSNINQRFHLHGCLIVTVVRISSLELK